MLCGARLLTFLWDLSPSWPDTDAAQSARMNKQVLIAGGGIGGLAAALACTRAAWDVRLYERAQEFGEVGAGIQIGPNVVRILHGWGLQSELQQVAAFPNQLQVRNAHSGAVLGTLPLGARAVQRYGAPYATIHRADMHRLLLDAVRRQGHVQLKLGSWVESFAQTEHVVTLCTTDGLEVEGDVLVGADGVWSRLRQLLLNDGSPRVTGHVAYRAMVLQSSLPAALRSQQVTAWMGPKLHMVQYPVRQGDWLNVVVVIHSPGPRDAEDWDQHATVGELRHALQGMAAPMRDLVAAIPQWRLWALSDREPLRSAAQMAQGRVALLGDAAHPMRPYLAQGAGMAIEDAAQLGRSLSIDSVEVPLRLQRYALNRWERCARVQARSIRNGEIFHAEGLTRFGRDLSLRLLGQHLLDVPWLYEGGAALA